MIEGLPLQTQSPDPHIKGYGCYAHCLAAMAQDQCGEVLLPWELRRLIEEAIDGGLIIDNDIQVTQKGWARIYVTYPGSFIKLVAHDLGHALLTCNTFGKETGYTNEPTTANYLIIEHKTKAGSHFVLAEIEKEYTYNVVYDPWPTLPRGEILTYRRWTVQR